MTAGIEAIFESVLNDIDYPTDGLVIEVVNNAIRRQMDATAHHYRWQIARQDPRGNRPSPGLMRLPGRWGGPET